PSRQLRPNSSRAACSSPCTRGTLRGRGERVLPATLRPYAGAMPERSAGILLYRRGTDGLEVLLVHPGGPFFARKDDGAWSIPKAIYSDGEEPLAAARREFAEELGSPCPDGAALELGEIRQKSGKRVLAWAVAGDLDADSITSNTFELEWPPR